MKSHTVIIKSECGLHARPAANVMKEAKKFKSAVRIAKGSKSCNAKSLVEILSLGVACGDEVTLSCEGEDEEAAADAVKNVIENNLEN